MAHAAHESPMLNDADAQNNAAALDPYPWYRRMRDTTPVYYDQRTRLWHVFRHADVQHVISDHAVFSSEFGQANQAVDPESRPITSSLIASDPPRHRQLRALVSQAFTPRAVAALTPRITTIVHELLDEIIDQGRMDVVEQLSYPLPVIVIAEMLGVPAGERAQFKRWSDAVVTFENSSNAPGGERQRRQAPQMREMYDYFVEMIAQRRRQPQNDLITQLMAAQIEGKYLTEPELIGFCMLLLIAGNVTTTNLIANALWCLDEAPQAMDQLRTNPELLNGAIEEVLRHRSPVKAMFRITRQAAPVGDQVIPAHQFVIAWLGSANRDERQFPDADRFNIARGANRHIAFGHGIHYCLGAPLARLEARIALQIMLQRLHDIRRDRDVALQPINSPILYSVKQMPITFTA